MIAQGDRAAPIRVGQQKSQRVALRVDRIEGEEVLGTADRVGVALLSQQQIAQCE